VSKLVGAKGDFRKSRSLKQHANGCLSQAKYDFLLVFYSDVR